MSIFTFHLEKEEEQRGNRQRGFGFKEQRCKRITRTFVSIRTHMCMKYFSLEKFKVNISYRET